MPRTPREIFAERIKKLDLPQARDYAAFLKKGDAGGPMPCWGAIFERFNRDFRKDAHRKALLDVALEVGDRRALVLFVHYNLDRQAVMRAILDQADNLPEFLQRALASLEEIADLVEQHVDRLAPAAQQIA